MLSKREWGHKIAKKAFSKLDALVKAQGRGAVSNLERSLGYEEGWFKNHRKPKYTMSLTNLLASLKVIGANPEEFFEELFEDEVFEDPEFDDPKPWIIDHACKGEPHSTCWSKFFVTVDDLRYDLPLEALEKLCRKARSVPEHHRAELLAIAGSCYRSLYALPAALQCLAVARQRTSDPWREGDVLQRMLYCYQPTNPKKALTLGAEAQLIFSTLGDRRKVAETLVDQAITFGVSGDIPRSEYLFRTVYSKHYAWLTPRNMVATAQGLAECYIRTGRKDRAKKWLELAQDELVGSADSSNVRAHLLWSLGKVSDSCFYLENAVDTFGVKHFFEAASVAIDFCKLALSQNKLQEAREMIGAMTQAATQIGDSVVARMFENISAQLNLGRAVNWAKQRAIVVRRRERMISSLLREKEASRSG